MVTLTFDSWTLLLNYNRSINDVPVWYNGSLLCGPIYGLPSKRIRIVIYTLLQVLSQ